MTRKPTARTDLETPYRRDFLASMDRLMKEGIMPEGLGKLLIWHEARVREEMPARLHGRGVWTSDGTANRGFPTKGGYQGPPLERIRIPGGSAMGTPQTGDAFRRYMEGNPRSLDADGYFDTPLRAALWTMACGVGRRSGQPLLARHLHLVARAGFDLKVVANLKGMTLKEVQDLTDRALRILWKKYAEYPKREREAA